MVAKKKVNKKKQSGAESLLHSKPEGDERKLVEHLSNAPCSVEFSRNAKGQPVWSLKLYSEFEDMDGALTEILKLDARLHKESRSDG